MARHLLLLGPEIDLHARIIGYYEIGIRHSVHFHSRGGAFVVFLHVSQSLLLHATL